MGKKISVFVRALKVAVELLITNFYAACIVSLPAIFFNPIFIFAGPVAFGLGFSGLIVFGIPIVVLLDFFSIRKKGCWLAAGSAASSMTALSVLFLTEDKELASIFLALGIPIGLVTGYLLYRRLYERKK